MHAADVVFIDLILREAGHLLVGCCTVTPSARIFQGKFTVKKTGAQFISVRHWRGSLIPLEERSATPLQHKILTLHPTVSAHTNVGVHMATERGIDELMAILRR